MNIEEVVMGARAYNVLKDAGIDTAEDLCLFTGEQLMRLGNFGRKSLDDVQSALSEHSLSLHTGAADPRLIVSFPGVGRRFNLGLSAANSGCESLAAYTARELARVQESLLLFGDACNWANADAAVDDQRTRWDAALRSRNGSRQERRAI
jgi:hypothetical protein